jgi:hypothetical protein
MTAPAFILEAETTYDTTTPKTTAAFNVLQGDVLIVYAGAQDSPNTLAISNNGVALSWVLLQSVVATNFTWLGMWGVVSTQSRSGLTVTITRTAGTGLFGGDLLLFRGSSGIGASGVANVATSTPTVNITTTTTNSAIVVANDDWNAVDGAARVWRTNAGALTETTYSLNGPNFMTIYGGYHGDAGAVGTYAVGLSAPAGQTYSIIAAEIKSLNPTILHVPIRLRLRG